MARLEAIKTRVTAIEVYRALENAWIALFGAVPRRESLCVLLAQWAFETGHGKHMRWFNLGNEKSRQTPGTNWCFYRCNEIIDGKTVWFDPDHPACCFRAFATLDEGAEAYLTSLSAHRKFKQAWPEVLEGDAAQFVEKLKVAGYFTADVKVYKAGVTSLNRQFLREINPTNPTFYAPSKVRDTVSLGSLAVEAVTELQTMLAKLGFYAGRIDGKFGPMTQAATMGYQKAEGIKIDGVVGRITWEHLSDDYTAAERETV
jgi:hypothetical protein